MNIRNQTIKKVCKLLNEDVEDQFSIKEMQAAVEGKSHFCVSNKNNVGIHVKNIYNENTDVSDYVITGYGMLVNNK